MQRPDTAIGRALRLFLCVMALLGAFMHPPAAMAQMRSAPEASQAPAATPTMQSQKGRWTCTFGPGGKVETCTVLPAPDPAPPPMPTAGLNMMLSRTITSADMKAISYFQRGQMKIDTRNAFGMVIIPRRAIDDAGRLQQRQFCELVLASLDFVAPEDVAPQEVLATYWPLISDIDPVSIGLAFESHDCQNLIAWYDHKFARDIAAKTGLQDKSGPLLVTWPSERTVARNQRDPLVVDFSSANQANAKRALAYWFQQLSQDPSLWTDRIREGTIRAGLAEAINETAGVMLAVLSGKWEGLAEVPAKPS
ncbi:MAG: hypothetical protein KJS87_09165 [Alphaproteobacteria bacterium]|nr:hypothetical protein [Alphaproteobacteria bacterium]